MDEERRVLTVTQLVAEPGLGLKLVAGAATANAVVRGVHIAETPDPTPWLDEGDVLLSTGLMIRDDEDEQAALIHRLREADVSALGLAVDFHLSSIPSKIVATADAVGLPVFEIPYMTPFKSIYSVVWAYVKSSDEVYRARRMVALRAELLELLLEGRSLSHMVSSLAMLLHTSVVLWSGSGTVLAQAHSQHKLSPAQVEGLWREYRAQAVERETRRPIDALGDRSVLVREAWSHGDLQLVMAVVVPGGARGHEMVGLMADFSEKLMGMHVLRRQEQILLDTRRRVELLDDLLAGVGSSAELCHRMAYYGFDLDRPMAFAYCDIVDFGTALEKREALTEEGVQKVKREFLDSLRVYLHRRNVPFLAMPKSDAVALLLQPGARSQREHLLALGRGLVECARAQIGWLDFRVGISSTKAGVDNIPRLQSEALQALTIAQRHGTDPPVVLFGELGPLTMLLENQPLEVIEALAESVLGDLMRHDEARSKDLTRSLRSYLVANRDLAAAAAGLHVHPNTLRYRLKKVEEIIGSSLEDTEVLVSFELAFRCLELSGRVL